MAVTLKDVPAVSAPECWVTKIKLSIAPGPTVIVVEVPDLVSAVAVMVAVSVLTNLNPEIPEETPEVKLWLPSAANVAELPLGESLPPVAQAQATEWLPV